MIKREELEHIALLAHLEFDDNVMDRLLKDMESIVAMASQLQSVDVDDFDGLLFNTDADLVWREDEPQSSYPTEKVIQNAPNKRASCVVVPKVVD